DTWEGIQSALPYLRREIGRRVRLRFTPSISFALDKSLDYSEHIQKLLLKVERGETND
ncbi:MAG: ribosome-binding factor A, partial [Selenomonadaceae bacterium]|nr:ribosome-binding factor A [Selenomonadaceae bacterium]